VPRASVGPSLGGPAPVEAAEVAPGPVVIGPAGLSIAEAVAVAAGARTIALAPEIARAIAASAARLDALAAAGARVYGLTTGFGPLADRAVASRDERDLQLGLVHHLAHRDILDQVDIVGGPLPLGDDRDGVGVPLR